MPSLDPMKKMPTNSPFANNNESKKTQIFCNFLVNNLFRNIFTTLKKKNRNQHQIQRLFYTHIEFLKEKIFGVLLVLFLLSLKSNSDETAQKNEKILKFAPINGLEEPSC